MQTETIIVSIAVPIVAAILAVTVPVIYTEMKKRKEQGERKKGSESIKRILKVLAKVLTFLWHAIPYLCWYGSTVLYINLGSYLPCDSNTSYDYTYNRPYLKYTQSINIAQSRSFIETILLLICLALLVYCLVKTTMLIRNAAKKRNSKSNSMKGYIP